MKAEELAARAPEEVLNQPPALENYNLFEFDAALREALDREGGGWSAGEVEAFGAVLGTFPLGIDFDAIIERSRPKLERG